MQKKAAFTLVELLAVIAILAIILLIAVPMILGVIEDAKIKAFRDSVLSVFHAAELAYMQTGQKEGMVSNLKMNYSPFMTGSYMIDTKGNVLLDHLCDGAYKVSFATTADRNQLVVEKDNGRCEFEIVLNGDNPENVRCSATEKYRDLGAMYQDQTITSMDTIDLRKAGMYQLHYQSGDNKAVRIVYVENDNVPELVIKEEEVTLMKGDHFDAKDLIISASDSCEGDITDKVQSESEVLTEVPGTYMVTYKVANLGGVEIQKKISVTVLNQVERKCHYEGNLLTGAEFVDGQYVYRYRQRGEVTNWKGDSSADGWGVKLKDKDDTSPVTTKLCTSINDKPIVFMSNMFSNSQASSIDFSSFNTSHVINMDSMFYQMTNITALDLRSFDTSQVKNMSYMFRGISKLEELNIQSFDTSNVTNMRGLFMKLDRLTTIDLHSFNTSKVTNMDNMFYGMINLTELDIHHFDTSNVTSMNYMFYNLKNLSRLDISNFDTSNVTSMNWLFRGMSCLEELDLRSASFDAVTYYPYFFTAVKTGLTIYAKDEAARTFLQNRLQEEGKTATILIP